MIQSTLNYTGGKFKLLPQIMPFFPKNINTFVDLFCGGCNVGINVQAKHFLYNNLNQHLLYLYNTLRNLDKDSVFQWIYEIINKYDLSLVSQHGYAFYKCDSSKGLGDFNKEGFGKLRHDFNEHRKNEEYDYYYYVMLYVLIVYSFNNQIRFNAEGYFNLPVGKRDFNLKMQDKLSNFIDCLKRQDCKFSCKDFREIDLSWLNEEDFVYVDPPYLITCASYNEQGGWSEKDEHDLLKFLDRLHKRKTRFALSNVLQSKGKINNILKQWLGANQCKYVVHHLNFNYANSNYQTSNKGLPTQEVLITNY